MTNRECVLKAIHFERAERVPYSVGFTHQMLEKMIAYTGNPDYASTIGDYTVSLDLIKPQRPLGNERFIDEYGVVWNKSGADKDIGVIDAARIGDIAQLPDDLIPPVDEAFIRAQMEHLIQIKGDNFSVAQIGFSLFERAWTLRGMEDLLCDMLMEPEAVHELLRRITDRNLKILDIALEYDIDAVYFGDDWGQQKGLIMGPSHWRTFMKPYLTQMYGKVRAAGKYVAQHSCGDIRALFDDLYEMGLNIYQTFQPEIYTYQYAEKLRGKISIWGGISTQMDLPFRTPEGIKEVVKELLAAFSGGGLIAGPTHAVPADVPPENIIAMMEVLEGIGV